MNMSGKLGGKSGFLCAALWLRPYIFGRYCHACGELMPVFERKLFCVRCRKTLETFRLSLPEGERLPQRVSLYTYGGPVRRAMLGFKFYNERQVGLAFAEELAAAVSRFGEDLPDLVCFVPDYSLRAGRRYHLTEILAEAVSGCLGIPVGRDVLVKKKKIPPQSGTRNRRQRLQNPRGAYGVKKNCDLSGKQILLIDDIVTTGATLRECTAALYSAGAKNVFRATVAKTSPFAAKRLIPNSGIREKKIFHPVRTPFPYLLKKNEI